MTVVDHYHDPELGFIRRFVSPTDHEALQGQFKTASVPAPRCFAWKKASLFPIHTPEDAYLSWIYAVNQADVVPDDILMKIGEAVQMYGYDPRSITEELQAPTEKVASSPDDYLLPEYRRLRVKTAADVAPAVQALVNGGKRLHPNTLAEASVRLINKAAELDIPANHIPLTTYKHAGLTMCDAGVLLDWMEARAAKAPTPETREVFTKIAQTILRNFPSTGLIYKRDDLIKIAEAVSEADQLADFEKLYNDRLLDPFETVFNTDKIASEQVDLAGTLVPADKLMQLPPDFYSDILGPEFLAEVSDPAGNMDPQMLVAVIQTLPDDMKQSFVQAAGPYLSRA